LDNGTWFGDVKVTKAEPQRLQARIVDVTSLETSYGITHCEDLGNGALHLREMKDQPRICGNSSEMPQLICLSL
jgi:hypothetical protein